MVPVAVPSAIRTYSDGDGLVSVSVSVSESSSCESSSTGTETVLLVSSAAKLSLPDVSV